MNVGRRYLYFLAVSIVVLFFGGCNNASDPVQVSSEPTTDLLPTETPLPSCADIDGECIELVFDGSNCTYDGSPLHVAGPMTFLFTNMSERNMKPELGKVADEHTFQEVGSHLGATGPTMLDLPDWVIIKNGSSMVPANSVHIWEGSLFAHDYTLSCAKSIGNGLFERWYGGGFTTQ